MTIGKIQITCLGLIFLLLLCGKAAGNDITLTSQVSAREISLNDQLYLTVKVSGAGMRPPELKLAPMPEFRIAGTPRTSTSTRIENFQTSFSVSYTYILVPQKEGSFDVGAVTVEHEGKKYSAPATTVKVVKDAVTQQQQRLPHAEAGHTAQSQNPDIFVNLKADKTECFIGEQITVSFEVMNRLTLADMQYTPPSFTGFWSVELPQSPKSIRLSGGRQYEHQAVNTVIFPTTAGIYTIEPATLSVTTLGGFFSRGRRLELKSDSFSITVKPLPEKGKSNNFSGAVGDFKLSAAVDTKTVKVGDVVTVKITVIGKGNLDLVTDISEPDLSAFKTYDPRVTDQISDSGQVVGGAKTWEYVIVPRQQGKAIIGPFTLSYFNPADGQYHRASTDPIELIVEAGEASVFTDDSNETNRQRVKTVGSDIRYIKPDIEHLASSTSRLHTNPFFYLFYVIPLASFSFTYVWKKRQDAIERNTGLKRKMNAWKHARRLLKDASGFNTDGNSTAFCGTIHTAITSYIGDILNLDTGSLTAYDIEQTLLKHGIHPDIAQRTRKNLELCDFVRFASTDTGTDIRDTILRETWDVMNALRESVK